MHHHSHNVNHLTHKADREVETAEQLAAVQAANRAFDARMGYKAGENVFTSLPRNPEYQPACPKPEATAEDIWAWHRP
jgi:hypothetical protein